MKCKIRGEKKPIEVELTRKSAILYFCKECMGFNSKYVEECTDTMCPLYFFRNAKAAKNKSGRKVNPKVIEALNKARKNKKRLPI